MDFHVKCIKRIRKREKMICNLIAEGRDTVRLAPWGKTIFHRKTWRPRASGHLVGDILSQLDPIVRSAIKTALSHNPGNSLKLVFPKYAQKWMAGKLEMVFFLIGSFGFESKLNWGEELNLQMLSLHKLSIRVDIFVNPAVLYRENLRCRTVEEIGLSQTKTRRKRDRRARAAACKRLFGHKSGVWAKSQDLHELVE